MKEIKGRKNCDLTIIKWLLFIFFLILTALPSILSCPPFFLSNSKSRIVLIGKKWLNTRKRKDWKETATLNRLFLLMPFHFYFCDLNFFSSSSHYALPINGGAILTKSISHIMVAIMK